MCGNTTSTLDPQPSRERMKAMLNLNSARLREETPHLSDALKRRAQSVINDKSIDAHTRAVIRYGLEINDPGLPELVRCVDAGESIIDNFFVPSSEEKIEALTDQSTAPATNLPQRCSSYSQPSKTPPTQKPSPTPPSTTPSPAAAN